MKGYSSRQRDGFAFQRIMIILGRFYFELVVYLAKYLIISV